MQLLWNKIIQGLNEIADDAYYFNYNLNDGATKADFKKLEKVIGVNLPQQFKDFYAIHDGENEFSSGIVVGDQLLCINAIITELQTWKDSHDNTESTEAYATLFSRNPKTDIKSNLWNPLWIPFTLDSADNRLCIDLNPATNGKFAQIIKVWHNPPTIEFIADSFKLWAENFAFNMVNDQYIYHEDFGLISRDLLDKLVN